MNSSEILNELRNLALKINPNLIEFTINTAHKVIQINGESTSTFTERNINIDDVQTSDSIGIFIYKGRHVLLYIPDHYWKYDDVTSGDWSGNKYHLTDCKTIDDMKSKNKFAKYIATNDVSGIFWIHGFSNRENQNKESHTKLLVCKNCLKKLNYKNYRSNKSKVFKKFNLDEFFKHYQTSFVIKPPNVGQGRPGYADDWKEISDNYKYRQYWTCEECRVNLSEHRQLLDTHHINGVKHHNDDSNLKALCKECHSKQPNHGHYYVSHDDKLKLQTLRKMQGLA